MNHTRIAPSPTGDMHLGTARTAYFNWLAARATGGTFTLRIDDTDQSRHIESAVQDIHDILGWLNISPDRVIRQSQRYEVYNKVIDVLLNKGLAKLVENDAVRLHIQPDQIDSFWMDDIVGKISIKDDDIKSINSLILRRADGHPTYHFASVVDDSDLGINLIIRGTDHIKNTPKHLAIYTALYLAGFNAPSPRFAHVGLIFNNGKKLSKRDGAASMLSYRTNEIDPDAVLNWMLRLGWGPSVDDRSTAVLTPEDAVRLFLDGGKMRASPAALDLAKLNSFDRKYKARKLK